MLNSDTINRLRVVRRDSFASAIAETMVMAKWFQEGKGDIPEDERERAVQVIQSFEQHCEHYQEAGLMLLLDDIVKNPEDHAEIIPLIRQAAASLVPETGERREVTLVFRDSLTPFRIEVIAETPTSWIGRLSSTMTDHAMTIVGVGEFDKANWSLHNEEIQREETTTETAQPEVTPGT